MHGFHIRRFALAVAGLSLLLLALVPAAVGADSPYPPNTVVSTYFDARFCGNGEVSVVTDQGGNLVNVCTATGQRIDPAAYGAPGYPYGYGTVYGTGFIPPYNTGIVPPVYGAVGNTQVIRQYIDNNSNCPNGDVTQTLSGFFCTATGQPAASSLSIPVFNGGYAPYVPGFNGGGFGPVGTGSIIRQFNDGRSNCPNGDVTETTSGFFCTATGQPAFRTS